LAGTGVGAVAGAGDAGATFVAVVTFRGFGALKPKSASVLRNRGSWSIGSNPKVW